MRPTTHTFVSPRTYYCVGPHERSRKFDTIVRVRAHVLLCTKPEKQTGSQ